MAIDFHPTRNKKLIHETCLSDRLGKLLFLPTNIIRNDFTLQNFEKIKLTSLIKRRKSETSDIRL